MLPGIAQKIFHLTWIYSLIKGFASCNCLSCEQLSISDDEDIIHTTNMWELHFMLLLTEHLEEMALPLGLVSLRNKMWNSFRLLGEYRLYLVWIFKIALWIHKMHLLCSHKMAGARQPRAWTQLFCYGAKKSACGCPSMRNTDLLHKAWTFIALKLFSCLACLQIYVLFHRRLPQVWSSGKHPTSKWLPSGITSCC